MFCELIVTADTREKDAKRVQGLQDYVEKHNGVFQKEGLPNNGGCDYKIEGNYKDSEINIGIEYKTLTDFAGSYQQLSGRFVNAYKLYTHVALFLEVPKYSFGIDEDGFHGTIKNPSVQDGSADVLKYFTFQGVMQSLARAGIYVVRIQSAVEFPYALGWFVNYISNPIHSTMEFGSKDYPNQYLSSLIKIPSVGVKAAIKLTKQYSCYQTLLDATQSDLQRCVGNRVGSVVFDWLRSKDMYRSESTETQPILSDLIVDYVNDCKTAPYDKIANHFCKDFTIDVIDKILIDLSSEQVQTGRDQQLVKRFVGDIIVFEIKRQ